MVKTISHGELRDGMINYRQGIPFRVTNLRVIAKTPDRLDLKEDVVRFDGVVADRTHQCAGTIYDSLSKTGEPLPHAAVYGAYVSVPTTIEVEE